MKKSISGLLIVLLIMIVFTSCTKEPSSKAINSYVKSSAKTKSTPSPIPTNMYSTYSEPASLNIIFDAKISSEYNLYNFDYFFKCTLHKRNLDDLLCSINDHEAVSLKITDANTKELVQEIEINFKYTTDSGAELPRISMLDINFDGYLDIFINENSAKSHQSYLCYIWDIHENMYVQHIDVQHIAEFYVDSKNNCITTYSRWDAGEYNYYLYKVVNNEIVCVGSLKERTNSEYDSIAECQKINGKFEIINSIKANYNEVLSDYDTGNRYFGEDSLWGIDLHRWEDSSKFIYSYSGSFE